VTIVHYDYRFDVTSRAASAAVTTVLETPGNCILLPFRAEGFDPRTARIDGAPAAAGSTFDGTTLRLCGERERERGDRVVLEMALVLPLRTLGRARLAIRSLWTSNRTHFTTS
jgi:hypothetical protein